MTASQHADTGAPPASARPRRPTRRDAASTLDAQLAALSAQDCPLPHVVVVVDDQSRDATAEIARSWAEGDRRIQLKTAQSGGHASSRNVGTAGALAGDLVAFCDADDVVAEGWLAALVRAAADADVVGGRLELELLNPPRVRRWRDVGTHDLGDHLGTPYAVTANLAVRAEALALLGGFDPHFDQGGADVDLALRTANSGLRTVFAPEAVVHYRLRDDHKGLRAKARRYGRSTVRLAVRYRDGGLPWPRRREPVRAWAEIAVLGLGYPLLDPVGRARWQWRLSHRVGRAQESWHRRVLHL